MGLYSRLDKSLARDAIASNNAGWAMSVVAAGATLVCCALATALMAQLIASTMIPLFMSEHFPGFLLLNNILIHSLRSGLLRSVKFGCDVNKARAVPRRELARIVNYPLKKVAGRCTTTHTFFYNSLQCPARF